MDKKAERLSKKIWRTKSARFNAHRRLQQRQSLFVWTTALTSLHLLIISIIQLSNAVVIPVDQNNNLSLITLVLSLVILIYSLIEGGKDYGLKSEQFHMCGVELGELEDQITYNESKVSCEKLCIDYHAILQKYMLNHLPIDDHAFTSKHKEEFDSYGKLNWFTKLKAWYFYYCANIANSLVVIIVPIFITKSIIFPC